MKSKVGPNYGLEVRYTLRAFTRAFTGVAGPLNLTPAEFRIMRPLYDGQICTQQELADLAALDRPYVTSLVRQMTERGLLQTKINAVDTRRSDLSLSKKGRLVFRRVTAELRKINQRAVAGISKADVEVFLWVARAIRLNLEDAD